MRFLRVRSDLYAGSTVPPRLPRPAGGLGAGKGGEKSPGGPALGCGIRRVRAAGGVFFFDHAAGVLFAGGGNDGQGGSLFTPPGGTDPGPFPFAGVPPTPIKDRSLCVSGGYGSSFGPALSGGLPSDARRLGPSARRTPGRYFPPRFLTASPMLLKSFSVGFAPLATQRSYSMVRTVSTVWRPFSSRAVSFT